MASKALSPFNCPKCGSGDLVEISIEEELIKGARRLPALVSAKCSKNHSLVLFVDGNFQIRDIEIAATCSEKDALDKTSAWFESL